MLLKLQAQILQDSAAVNFVPPVVQALMLTLVTSARTADFKIGGRGAS